MKRFISIILLCLFAGMLVFAYGCKKSGSPDKSPRSAEEQTFNPDEPAPVPKGTPPY